MQKTWYMSIQKLYVIISCHVFSTLLYKRFFASAKRLETFWVVKYKKGIFLGEHPRYDKQKKMVTLLKIVCSYNCLSVGLQVDEFAYTNVNPHKPDTNEINKIISRLVCVLFTHVFSRFCIWFLFLNRF